eukprot:gene1301-1440_t
MAYPRGYEGYPAYVPSAFSPYRREHKDHKTRVDVDVLGKRSVPENDKEQLQSTNKEGSFYSKAASVAIPSEALGGSSGNMNEKVVRDDKENTNNRIKRQQAYPYANYQYGYPAYREKEYNSTQRRNRQHKVKRQLFGVTSIVSPVGALKTTIYSENSNGRSQVPADDSSIAMQRNTRQEPEIEVPIRAEEHHGVVTSKSEVTGENKKSKIQQRIEKRESDDTNHEQKPVKRQFVFNSEPPVVRATVKGPMPGGSENAMNMKSSEYGVQSIPDVNRDLPYAPPQQPQQVEDMYSKAGILMDDMSRRRAESQRAKETMAEKEALVQQKEAASAKEQAMINRQAQMNALAEQRAEQRAAQERALEREREIDREQELQEQRAREMAYLTFNQQQQQLDEQRQAEMMPVQSIQKPVEAEATPEVATRETQTVPMSDAYSDEMTGQSRQLQYPMAAFQDGEAYAPMPLMRPTLPAAYFPTPTMYMMPQYPAVPFAAPTVPMFTRRQVLVHNTNDLTALHHYQPHYQRYYQTQQPHYQDRMPMSLSKSEYQQPHTVHSVRRHHTPTQPPYHVDEGEPPYEDEDDEKPEVHVHIQTEKSKIPKIRKKENKASNVAKAIKQLVER